MKHFRQTFRIFRWCLYAAIMCVFVALAIRGNGRWEHWWTPTMRPQLELTNYSDRVEFTLVWLAKGTNPAWGRGGYDGHPEEPGPASWVAMDSETHFDDTISSRFDCLGILLRTGAKSTGGEVPANDSPFISLLFPQWLPAVLAILPLVLAAWRARHRPRADHPQCATCSYDLRAHHPGDKCPECGMNIPAPAV